LCPQNYKKNIRRTKFSVKKFLILEHFCNFADRNQTLLINNMEIEGKIIAAMPEQGGVSQRTGNAWKSQDFVIETIEQFPKKCVFRVFGAERLAQFNIQVGENLRVSFDIDAHEYQGRWFNDIRAWRVDRYDPAAAQAAATGAQPMPTPGAFPPPPAPGVAPAAAPAAAPFPPAQPAAEGGDAADDLPF
jgi:hypothetical protein